MRLHVCWDCDWLANQIETHSALAARSQIVWSPVLRAAELWRSDSLRAVVDHVICDSHDSFEIAAARFDELVLLEPPPNDSAASSIAEVAQSRRVTVCIDHFFHAELLSRACQRLKTQIAVLVEIDVGKHHVGVRPGYDAQRVALAAAQLPGIAVAGVSGDVQFAQALTEEPPTTATNESFADALKVLRHSMGLIQRQTNDATRFLVRGHRFDPEYLRQFDVTDFADITFLDASPVLIHSLIVSRPTLDRAVINAGSRLLNVPNLQSISLPPGVQISDMDQNSSVLSLVDRALDLVIGDEVLIRISAIQ